jgi:hypothetical protein
MPTSSLLQRTVLIKLESTEFQLCDSLGDLFLVIENENRGVLRFITRNYSTVHQKLCSYIENKFGIKSRQYLDCSTIALFCAGCLWEYPDTYLNQLRLGKKFQDMYPSIVGAMPGHTIFGKTGICTQCDYHESLLVYECFRPESITKTDIRRIKRYFQEEAKDWWKSRKENWHHCDYCAERIFRDQGFIDEKQLLCVKCINEKLEDGLINLKSYPHFYGKNLLRKARAVLE